MGLKRTRPKPLEFDPVRLLPSAARAHPVCPRPPPADAPVASSSAGLCRYHCWTWERYLRCYL